jgi:hypothetical protein
MFYQCVARIIVRNARNGYGAVCRILQNGRDAGLIDWNHIEDRTREMSSWSQYEGPSEAIKDAAIGYAENLWKPQLYRPRVLIEKDALLGVIEGVCGHYRAPYGSLRGNVSASTIYDLGKQCRKDIGNGNIPVILYLGDHDPNGIDMTRDVRERLMKYARQPVEVRRLALNWDQRANLPPNFAKETDTRFKAYFGRPVTNRHRRTYSGGIEEVA